MNGERGKRKPCFAQPSCSCVAWAFILISFPSSPLPPPPPHLRCKFHRIDKGFIKKVTFQRNSRHTDKIIYKFTGKNVKKYIKY
jgi:hypothetical protein